jgi:AcrR family transcriptional regulator
VSAKAPPPTRRGIETRAALLAAARAVFERDGFLAARIADITATADVASGTFYTYFEDKHEIFAAVLGEAEEEMLHPDLGEVPRDDPRATIEAANRAYLLSYRKNAKLMAAINQVATIDARQRELTRKRSEAFIKRNAASIRRLQKEGLADPEIDPHLASRALSGMVSRMAYDTFVLGQRASLEALVATLTALWANALKIEPRGPAATSRRR